MAARSAAKSIPIGERKPSKGGAVDGRTLVARRRRELIEIYTIALGGPGSLSEGQQIDIRKAAELTALAEQARARAMREGTAGAAELSVLIRLESTALRVVRALNLPSRGTAQKPKSLADHIAQRAARLTGKPGGDPT